MGGANGSTWQKAGGSSPRKTAARTSSSIKSVLPLLSLVLPWRLPWRHGDDSATSYRSYWSDPPPLSIHNVSLFFPPRLSPLEFYLDFTGAWLPSPSWRLSMINVLPHGIMEYYFNHSGAGWKSWISSRRRARLLWVSRIIQH